MLPKQIRRIHTPPIKIQGIKTKLLPFITSSIKWNGNGTWYEPFMGSGVVGFNIQPKYAVFSDTNPYLIDFYKDIQNHKITPQKVRSFLAVEGSKLAKTPKDKHSYYYQVRDRFNKEHNPLDLLFLQRSNFNGMMRFSRYGYNSPFCRKPQRFHKSLITKIVNQVKWVQHIMKGKHWIFKAVPWQAPLKQAKNNDFAYLDPPYIGRNATYFNSWKQSDADNLAKFINHKLKCGYAMSMWYKDRKKVNPYLKEFHDPIFTNQHYYYIGPKIQNRGTVIEALVVRKKNAVNKSDH